MSTPKRTLNSLIAKGTYQKAITQIQEGHNDTEERDEDGRTPLMMCSFVVDEYEAIGLARALLEKGSKVAVTDLDGMNAIHYCCIRRFSQLVDVLLSAADGDVHVKCKKAGNTPLHYAVISCNLGITRLIVTHLKRYKQNLNVKNNLGLTPLQLALKLNYPKIKEVLIGVSTANLGKYTGISRLEASSMWRMHTHIVHDGREKSNGNTIQRNVQSTGEDKRLLPKRHKLKHPCMSFTFSQSGNVEESTSWRDVIPLIYNRYEQQYCPSYRSSAAPSKAVTFRTTRNKTSTFQEVERIKGTGNISSMSGTSKRRHSSMAYLQRPSRKTSILSQSKASATRFEMLRSRRQSVAV